MECEFRICAVSMFGIKAALVTPQKEAPSSAQLGVRSDQNIKKYTNFELQLLQSDRNLNFVNLKKITQ